MKALSIILGGLIGFSGPFAVELASESAFLQFIPLVYFGLGMLLAHYIFKQAFKGLMK